MNRYLLCLFVLLVVGCKKGTVAKKDEEPKAAEVKEKTSTPIVAPVAPKQKEPPPSKIPNMEGRLVKLEAMAANAKQRLEVQPAPPAKKEVVVEPPSKPLPRPEEKQVPVTHVDPRVQIAKLQAQEKQELLTIAFEGNRKINKLAQQRNVISEKLKEGKHERFQSEQIQTLIKSEGGFFPPSSPQKHSQKNPDAGFYPFVYKYRGEERAQLFLDRQKIQEEIIHEKAALTDALRIKRIEYLVQIRDLQKEREPSNSYTVSFSRQK